MGKKNKEVVSIILDLESSIEYVYPSFAKEREQSKHCMLKGLHCISPLWDDEGRVKWKEKNNIPIIEKDDNVVSVPCNDLRELGTRQNTFNKIILKYPLLEMVDARYNHKLEKARGYRLTEDYAKVLSHYLQQEHPKTYIMIRGFDTDMLVNSDSVNKNTLRKKTKDDLTIATVSPDKVKEYLDTVDGLSTMNRTRLTYLYGIAYSTGGVRQDYHRNKTGRLTVKGMTNLQNISKVIRNQLFDGCYEIDMIACQWKIAAHYTSDPVIAYYAENSTQFRNDVMQELGMPDSMGSDVKTALIAILFGCKRDGTDGPIKDKLGEWAVEFMKHPSVRALVKAVDELVRKVRSEGKLDKWKRLDNTKGWRQLLSLFLQNKEAMIMDVCRKYVVNPDLLLYDGIITRKDVDVEALQKHVLEVTGFNMSFSKKRIGEDL